MELAHILIPTETINRELDFQLFLAAKLLRPGRRIFIGKLSSLRVLARHLRGGVYVGRCFDPTFPDADLSFYRELKERGLVFVHLDEEGAVFPNGEDNWRRVLLRRLDPRELDARSDYVCTWGDFQNRVYAERAPALAPRIRTTGHPRFDLYRPELRAYFESEAETIRRRHGRFVIVNTNTSLANHGAGLDYVFSKRAGYPADDAEQRTYHLETWAHTTTLMARLVKLVHRLSVELPHLKIVVRPHPSEKRALYETILGTLDNVEVIHEGSVGPWLMASRALIHHDCTTAIEAHIADVPIVDYESAKSGAVWMFLPGQVGSVCRTEEEAVELIRRADEQGRLDDTRSPERLAGELFANLLEPAFPRVLDVVEEALGDASRIEARFDRDRWRLAAGVEEAVERAKTVARRFSPRRLEMQTYARNKFWGFQRPDVADRWRRVQALLGMTGHLVRHGSRLLEIDAGPPVPG